MPTHHMWFTSAISDKPDPLDATKSVVNQVSDQLDGRSADLVAVFVSPLYHTQWDSLIHYIRQTLESPVLLGCTAGGVLAGDQELEHTPAIAMAAAHLPDVTVRAFAVSPTDIDEAQGSGFWIEKIGVTPDEAPITVLLPEPYSCDVSTLVDTLNTVYPNMPIVGGLASGAEHPGGHLLFLEDHILQTGAVGVTLTGNIELQTIVSQGCRPIGETYIVTKGEDTIIEELAGTPALEALQELFHSLSPHDQELAQQALFIGLAMDEHKVAFGRGDFLVRHLVGMDQASGALQIGDHVQVGQTVQFQLRDAEASREDLRSLLDEYSTNAGNHASSIGGLLFSCLGRGIGLYGEPHHDLRTIQTALGNCPIAGFFCNGEIGPVAGRNFIHGYTSSLGLFQPKSA